MDVISAEGVKHTEGEPIKEGAWLCGENEGVSGVKDGDESGDRSMSYGDVLSK